MTCDTPHHALLPLVQSVVKDLRPDDWSHCASFLTGLLERAPLNNKSNDPGGWTAEQWILGCLATELRLMAHEAGEPLPAAGEEARPFGEDPLAKARQRVADLTSQQLDADSARERQRATSEARLGRLQERWDTPSSLP